MLKKEQPDSLSIAITIGMSSIIHLKAYNKIWSWPTSLTSSFPHFLPSLSSKHTGLLFDPSCTKNISAPGLLHMFFCAPAMLFLPEYHIIGMFWSFRFQLKCCLSSSHSQCLSISFHCFILLITVTVLRNALFVRMFITCLCHIIDHELPEGWDLSAFSTSVCLTPRTVHGT